MTAETEGAPAETPAAVPRLIRVLDVETTGLDPRLHRIVEIATLDCLVTERTSPGGPWDFERGETWSSFVNPEMPIPPEASGVHDITDDLVAGAPKMGPEILERVKSSGIFPAPAAFCAHNSRFDSGFIKPEGVPWLDTYRIALWLWPDAPNHKNNTLRYFLKLKLATPDGVIHRAARDVYITAAILRRAFHVGATFEQMLAVSNEPALLPRLGFGEHAMKPIADVPDSYLDWILRKGGFEEDVAHTAYCELERRRRAKP